MECDTTSIGMVKYWQIVYFEGLVGKYLANPDLNKTICTYVINNNFLNALEARNQVYHVCSSKHKRLNSLGKRAPRLSYRTKTMECRQQFKHEVIKVSAYRIYYG